MNSRWILIILAISLSSCVGTKRFSKFIYKKYDTHTVESGDRRNSYITISTTNLPTQDSLANVKKIKSLFIPAIFYWQWEGTISCELAPRFQAGKFATNMLLYADSAGLQEKLNGQRLEISIDSLPHSFMYTNKGFTLFFIVGYIMGAVEAIYPQDKNLKISYKLIRDTTQIKIGSFVLARKLKTMENIWSTTKKFTWKYLDRNEIMIKILSKEAIEKLITESL